MSHPLGNIFDQLVHVLHHFPVVGIHCNGRQVKHLQKTNDPTYKEANKQTNNRPQLN